MFVHARVLVCMCMCLCLCVFVLAPSGKLSGKCEEYICKCDADNMHCYSKIKDQHQKPITSDADGTGGHAAALLPLLQREHPTHLFPSASGPNGVGTLLLLPAPSPVNWSLLLLLLLLHTLVHLAWAWHLVEVQ